TRVPDTVCSICRRRGMLFYHRLFCRSGKGDAAGLDRLQLDRRKEPPAVCQLSFGRYGPQRRTSRFRNKGGWIIHFEEIAHRGHETGGDVEKGAVLNLDQCRSGDIFAPDPTHVVSLRIRHTSPPDIIFRLQDSGPAGFAALSQSSRSPHRPFVGTPWST